MSKSVLRTQLAYIAAFILAIAALLLFIAFLTVVP